MPAPTTADELLDLIQKSSLLEEPRLRAYAQKLRDTSTFPADPQKLAALLVRDAQLTYFQAEQLLQGKYKRFSLGKYKVLERLGQGGMGTVFLCEHKLMRRRVAVKVLPIQKVNDKASLDRFYREARAIAAVDHPNIVRAYDIDQDENLHFLVMEWVDGTNLHDLVKKFGPLDILRACHYVYGSAVGLQHAYECGLLHRDIKPGNILVDRAGVVKILDLGLARITHDTEDNLTRQNDENVLGTADYLAPEQAMDSHTVDIRADIYSLGATFYYLLTGGPPFPEGSVAQKLIWHQNRMPRPLKSLRPDTPDALVAIIERMMAKDQEKRFQTPAEVMAALAPWVAAPIAPPAEREMPTLSPVVAGGLGGSRSAQPLAPTGSHPGGAPRTVPLTGGSTFTGMPTAVTLVAPQVAPASRPTANDTPAVWATLDEDTQSGARGDTEPPGAAEKSPEDGRRTSRRAPAQSGGGNAKVFLLGVGAAVLLAAVAAGVYFALFHKGDSPPTNPGASPNAGSGKIIVSKAGGENAAPTLREAILKAGSGDTIVITEPSLVEPPLTLSRAKHRDLTIGSATPDGKPAVIEFLSSGGKAGGVMLNASDADGFHLKNVEFDGNGQADIGIQLGGITPGVTLEGVTVRNVVQRGIDLWSVAGDAARPVTLDHVRVLLGPTGEGVLARVTGQLDNKFVVIKNSRFEGPGRIGLRIDGPTSEFEVSNNRFYNLTTAVSFARLGGKGAKGAKGAKADLTSEGKFVNNTVYQASVGLRFELAQKDAGRFEWEVARNYFAHTTDLLKAAGPVPGLKAEDNLRDATSKPGNPPLASEKTDAVLPKPNPEVDSTFLFFPVGEAPAAGAK